MRVEQLATARAAFNDSVATFLSWWGRELLSCVPPTVRAALAPDARCTVLRLTDDCVELRDVRRGPLRRAPRERILISGDVTSIAPLLGRSRRRLGRLAPLHVRVPLARCLVREVVLPVAALKRLEAVLALDLERTTPFKRNEVFSAGFASEASPGPRGTTTVQHVVFKAAAVAPVLDSLQQQGLTLTAVEVEADDGKLLPVRLTRGGVAREPLPILLQHLNRLLLALAVTVIVTAAAALGLSLHQQQHTLSTLAAETSDLQKRATTLRQRMTAAEKALADAASVRARKIDTPGLVQILEELSRALPDHAWISELQLAADGLVIDGHARSAPDLVGLLASVPLLKDVAFAAPVTRDPGKGVERFRIRCRIERATSERS